MLQRPLLYELTAQLFQEFPIPLRENQPHGFAESIFFVFQNSHLQGGYKLETQIWCHDTRRAPHFF
jgi:hypothetical protein